MYQQFFDFTRKPFHITPDPECMFLSPSHKDALTAITCGVECRVGLIEIVGEVGLGKTTVLWTYLESIESEDLKPVVLFNPNIAFKKLLETIYRNLDWEFPADTELSAVIDHLHDLLLEEYKCNRNIVVIIDEAQHIPVETLKQLHLLSDLREGRDNLLQIVLVGQPELERKINGDGLRRLRQSIAVRVEILPLTATESSEYIQFRLSKVSTGNAPVFAEAAMTRIVEFCDGIPRVINSVCDNALTTAFKRNIKPVSHAIVEEVIGELQGKKESARRWRLPIATAAAVVLLAACVLLPFWRTIAAKFQGFRSGPVVYEDRLSPGPDKNASEVKDGKPLPATSAADPAPSVPPASPGTDAAVRSGGRTRNC